MSYITPGTTLNEAREALKAMDTVLSYYLEGSLPWLDLKPYRDDLASEVRLLEWAEREENED